MPNFATVHIYVAIQSPEDRSHIEDQLVLDGADVSSFTSARELWEALEARPARFVITERQFGDDFSGLELARRIREQIPQAYVYVLMRSTMCQMTEIEEGLSAGVDGYLVKPHNAFQIRSQVLVGLKWLTYIDSVTNEARTVSDDQAFLCAAGHGAAP